MSLQLRTSNISCGVKEAYNIPDNPEEAALSIAEHLYRTNGSAAFVIFSDVTGTEASGRANRGAKLAEYLMGLKCGKVVATDRRKNPNSGNMIQAWVFVPAHTKFRPWFQAQTAAPAPVAPRRAPRARGAAS